MDFSSTVAKIKPSVALIYTFDSAKKVQGTGSGFVFGKKGILVTCNHVIKDAGAILIKFPNKEDFDLAKVVLKDEEHDLALLKFDDDKREPLDLADPKDINEGMQVLFSGYPLSIESLTTHQGILSSVTKDSTNIATYLIDGTVNSGNSGCPLMDINGKVIGVVNAKRREYNDILEKVEKMAFGAISLHGVDLVRIYRALIDNVQLGIGYAVPASYIPTHKSMPESEEANLKDLQPQREEQSPKTKDVS